MTLATVKLHTLIIGQAATAAFTLRRNVICLVKGEDTVQLMEKLHQLTRDNA